MKKLLVISLLTLCWLPSFAAEFSPEDNACQAPCVVQDSSDAKSERRATAAKQPPVETRKVNLAVAGK